MQDEDEWPSDFDSICDLVEEHFVHVLGFIWHIQALKLLRVLMYCLELIVGLSDRKPVNTADWLKEQ